jgi:ribosome-associated heat shock protein Hsp15
MRLDKWLWAARFYKTRHDAVEAIKGGHVHLDGQRTKPGRDVHPGSRLHITKGSYEWDIEVLVLSKQRRPAAEASTFYREDPASHERRQQRVAEARAAKAALPLQPTGRPSKRDRRLIHRFKQSHDGS